MGVGNPTFGPSAPPGKSSKEQTQGQERKRTIEEGMRILSERLRKIISDRRVTAIKHEGFYDGRENIDGDNRVPYANFHMYTITLENNGKIWGLKVRAQDPINDAFMLHTGVNLAGDEEWVYDFDGETKVEVTDPKGHKQVISLDEEHTLDSLETYLRSTMTRTKVAEESYTG